MVNFTAVSTADLPSDVYYFAKLTSTNLSGIVWVVCIISLTYALLSSGVRFTLRRGIYGFDDAALLVSTLACIVQHSFIFLALNYGLGNAKSSHQLQHSSIATSTYTRVVLFFVVHTMAKVSLTLFTRRLFHGQDWYNAFICDALLVLNCICGVISLLLMSINCSSGWYFSPTAVCPNLWTRWAVIKALDVVTELALVFVPILLICNILFNHKHKMIIIGTYAARLPVIAFTIIHFFQLRKSMRTTGDRAVSLVYPIIWLQVTLLWSMVTASLPSFKPLISAFDTVVEESTGRSDPVATGAGLVMGPDSKVNPEEPLTTWTTMTGSQTNLSQLETVTSTANRRADFTGHNETIIKGPKRKFFNISRQGEEPELGAIYHERNFEVKYEKASKPSLWSRAWCGADGESLEKEAMPAAVEKTDETPAPRRRSAYAFPEEADEAQGASSNVPPT